MEAAVIVMMVMMVMVMITMDMSVSKDEYSDLVIIQGGIVFV